MRRGPAAVILAVTFLASCAAASTIEDSSPRTMPVIPVRARDTIPHEPLVADALPGASRLPEVAPPTAPATAATTAPISPPTSGPRCVPFVIDGTHFEPDSWELPFDSRPRIDEAVAEALRRPTAPITITGHTDRRVSAIDNDKLGLHRAQSAANELIASGVAVDLIAVVSAGASQPKNPADTPQAWAENRRIEIVIHC